MQLTIDQLYRRLRDEAFLHRRAIVWIFIAVNLVAITIGLVWPKGYSAAAIILVDEKNIIQPLMQGAAVTTEVADRSKMVKQFVYGRKMMQELLEYGGWLKDGPTATQQERLIKKLTRRTQVVNLGRNLIKIEYSDEDAERSYRVAQRMAERFIEDSLLAKAEESQAAYDFIDKQTKEYHGKLAEAEAALKEFRSLNLDALPGSETDISARLNVLQGMVEQAQFELKEAEIRKVSIEKQLSGEAEVSVVLSREGQYRSRISDLQGQLDSLRLSFHDAHPDIVRLRHQIEDLNQAIADERRRREEGRPGAGTPMDETMFNNPVYQQLRGELAQTRTNVDTLRARIGEGKRQLERELERGKRVQGGGATLAELTRDYQVNREIYQDLLKRRETARVSMNLDRDKQGLSFKIYEPATLPLEPSGLRYLHFLLIGLVLGIGLPVGLLYARLRFDPRVRLPDVIERRFKLPLLGSVPHLWAASETAKATDDVRRLAMLVGATIVLMAVVSVLRLAQVV
jgi:polysaccharide chain length determinant protein (PEP-CTERM system associated)